MLEIKEKSLSQYTFIDLFAGIGGFRLALESLGAKCLFSSEIDDKARKTYEMNFGEIPAGDIRKIQESEIPEHDILCAGFPCQSFSASGMKAGFDDSRGQLFFEIERIAKHCLPKVIFMENVMYFLAHDNGHTLDVVKSSIEKLGYVFYYTVLNAANYGVPQQRKRTYMVAFRKDIDSSNFFFPFPTPLFKTVNDIMIHDESLLQHLYLNREIYPPKRKARENYDEVILVGYFNQGRQGERVYNPAGVSITLSTTNKAIFTTTSKLEKPRRLHPRECARLMGFPDSFKIYPVNLTAYKQFGNSVVVDVIQYIALQISSVLNNDNDDSLFS